MDIFVPNRKLWTPDHKIITPRFPMHLTPHRVMMGAAGVSGDEISYAFDGTGDYLTAPDHADWAFGSGDFTIDFWIRFAVIGTYISLVTKYFQTSQRDFYFTLISGATLAFYFCTGSGDGTGKSVSWSPSTITWYHVAVARDGNNLRFFIGGTQQGSTQDVTGLSVANTASELAIAAIRGTSAWRDFVNGNMDEIRITKGVARWTSNFTPPTREYASDANTPLLIHCGETKSGTTGSGATFTDSGNTGHTVTENGNAIEDTVNYKF